jgi:hypothetical protein
MGGIFLYRSRCFWVVEYIWSECIGGSNIYIRYELSLGYAIRVDELEKSCTEKMLFVHPEEVENQYSIPAAFEKYAKYVNVKLGQEKFEE